MAKNKNAIVDRIPKIISTLTSGEFRITLNVLGEMSIWPKHEKTGFCMQKFQVKSLYEFLKRATRKKII